jgi:uncharacterized CHY-type Zn-finger protein
MAHFEEVIRRLGKPAAESAPLGCGTCKMDLTDEQYIRLLEAGCRYTRNTNEKRKARGAGNRLGNPFASHHHVRPLQTQIR